MIESLSTLGSSWIFWIILVVIIAFIVYSGLKKRKSEKKEKRKREKEVKTLIKNHVKEEEGWNNVVIDYVDVKSRSGKIYKNRDVYDVFVNIKNPRTQKIISKKAYEIEGFAKPLPGKSKDFIVDWTINCEFKFQQHLKLLKNDSSSSLLGIYLKSLIQKNRSEYIKKQKGIRKYFQTKRDRLDKELKKIQTENLIFRPKPKKKE